MLRLNGVFAGYGGGDVLQGVDIEVERGSVSCIVGPNGAGKSTVLRAVSGLIRPRLGEIELEGDSVCGLHPAQILDLGVSQVPQSNALFPNITVKENVLMGAYIRRRDRDFLKSRYEEIAELFPVVEERASEKAGNLSGSAAWSSSHAR
jgi:ABC-type branched-subunit amino acid transport system ATPase component